MSTVLNKSCANTCSDYVLISCILSLWDWNSAYTLWWINWAFNSQTCPSGKFFMVCHFWELTWGWVRERDRRNVLPRQRLCWSHHLSTQQQAVYHSHNDIGEYCKRKGETNRQSMQSIKDSFVVRMPIWMFWENLQLWLKENRTPKLTSVQHGGVQQWQWKIIHHICQQAIPINL